MMRVSEAPPLSDGADAAAIERAVVVLQGGGLVAFPTETVYGLGGLALDPRALASIFAAKGRPVNHPLIAHVLDVHGARALAAAWSPLATRLASAFWPGPLTLVVPRAAHVPLALTGGGDSVAVRAPSHPVARALLAALGAPLAAPSANRYQTLSPTTAAHVAASLGGRVAMILDGGACAAGIESTVVDVRGEVPVVLRPGALDLPTLAAVVAEVTEAPRADVDDHAPHASPGLDRRHYAPRARLVIAASRAVALEEAAALAERGEPVGLVLREPLADGGAELPRTLATRALGADPRGYAHRLFAALHELDARGVVRIIVEPVPSSAEWRAIADRLDRAGAAG